MINFLPDHFDHFAHFSRFGQFSQFGHAIFYMFLNVSDWLVILYVFVGYYRRENLRAYDLFLIRSMFNLHNQSLLYPFFVPTRRRTRGDSLHLGFGDQAFALKFFR